MAKAHTPPAKRSRWKLLLNIITVLALLLLVYALRDQLVTTVKNLGRVHGWFLLLMVPIELLNYHAQTRLYQTLFLTVGRKLEYWFTYKFSVELNFVNHVFPSGGVSGISYMGLRLKNQHVDAAASTVVQLMKLVLIFISCGVLLAVGVFALAVNGRADNLVILLSSSLVTLLVAGMAAFFYIIGSRERINALFVWCTRVLNRLIQLVRPHHPETISIASSRDWFDALHDNYMAFRHKLRELNKPFWYATLANVTEIATLYVVYLAFGIKVNVGAVILAYQVANFAGLVSVLPGGVGIYEALMTAVLAAAGVPAGESLPVTVMYRVLNTVLQVPPGYILYQRNLQHTDTKPIEKVSA